MEKQRWVHRNRRAGVEEVVELTDAEMMAAPKEPGEDYRLEAWEKGTLRVPRWGYRITGADELSGWGVIDR